VSASVVITVVVVLPCVPAIGTPDHGNPERATRYQFRMLARHGRCDDQRARIRGVRSVMARHHHDAEARQGFGIAGRRIAPRYADAASREQLGQTGHPRSADTHEMHGPRIGRAQE
jgi:hypothetical protein